MPDYTQKMRQSLDNARNQLEMPQTVELVKKAQSGPNKGGYEVLYTVDGGWFISYEDEEVDGKKASVISMFITDDRDDMTREIIQMVSGFRYRGLNHRKTDARPTLSDNPKYWQLSFETTGEKA